MRPSAVALLVLSLIAAGCGSPEPTAEAAPDAAAAAPVIDVAVVKATLGPVESALEISGTLAPRSRVAVKPKLPGTLERVLVDIGDAVTEGQTIATIDRREIDAQADAAVAAVNVAKAALATADAALASAVLEHERAGNLFEKGALPRQRLDAADTAHRSAVAQRDLAAANLAQAQAALRRVQEVQNNTTIKSPVTGYVVARNYDAGALPGDLPARVSVQAKPGTTFPGQLAAIAPEVNERNRHFMVDVRVPNEARALLSGMYATAHIVEATRAEALLLPKDAVTTREGKRVVQKVQGDTVQFVEVVEGLSDATRVQIVSGLAAGDLVLADARRQLASGARVRAIER
jgi:multidrug efflux pump subunit AcrA (membrane-fusion protein)